MMLIIVCVYEDSECGHGHLVYTCGVQRITLRISLWDLGTELRLSGSHRIHLYQLSHHSSPSHRSCVG